MSQLHGMGGLWGLHFHPNISKNIDQYHLSGSVNIELDNQSNLELSSQKVSIKISTIDRIQLTPEWNWPLLVRAEPMATKHGIYLACNSSV